MILQKIFLKIAQNVDKKFSSEKYNEPHLAKPEVTKKVPRFFMTF